MFTKRFKICTVLHHKMFPVTSGDRLLGCVTTRDVQQVPRNEWATTTVAHISGKCEQENTIESTSDAMDVLAQMSRNGSSRIMVVDGDRLVGMLTLRDLLQFISLKMELEGAIARWENEGGSCADCVLDSNPNHADEVRRTRKPAGLVSDVSDGKKQSSDQIAMAHKLR